MALLQISERQELGTRQCRKLRERGLVPGIIYGHGEANLPVFVSAHDIELAIGHGEQLVETSLGGGNQNLLIKDVQHDYLGHDIIHVDFTRVSLDERVEVTVPVMLRGTPIGVESEDGVLTQHVNEVTVECLVTAIPEDIRVPVAKLHVNDSLRVADLELPEGVRVIEDPETVVVSISMVAEEEEVPAEEAEAVAEPEVIGEEAPEGEAPSAEEGESA